MKGRFLKPSQIAAMCSVTPAGVRKWIRSGRLNAYSTPGGQYRIEETDLHRFLTEHGLPVSDRPVPSKRNAILVVDDEPDIVELIRETVAASHPDYYIIPAYDGYDACIVAGAERPWPHPVKDYFFFVCSTWIPMERTIGSATSRYLYFNEFT